MLTGLLLDANEAIPADPADRSARLVAVPAARRYFGVK